MITDEWKGCYKRGWGRELVPEAYSHPAKVSFSLAERIYQHMIAEGWLHLGDRVIDPFGGIGGFAYHALKHGLHFVGVELEPKFVDLAAQNIALWNKRYAGRFARWGTAQVLQGDSRRLLEIVSAGAAAVSSPPYAESLDHAGGIDPSKSNHIGGPHSQIHNSDTRYGQTPGQLAAMRVGEFDGAVSSPPYDEGLGHNMRKVRPIDIEKSLHMAGGSLAYGESPGQLAQEHGETFWSAARVILEQTFAALRPGGHAVWVVKHFVRDGALVDFPGQWQQLCESVGFVTLHEHRASLVREDGMQLAMDGNHKRHRVKRVSFFRRLHEQKQPDLAIDFETVFCMSK